MPGQPILTLKSKSQVSSFHYTLTNLFLYFENIFSHVKSQKALTFQNGIKSHIVSYSK